MTRARDMANLGSQAGSGLDASDITTGTLGSGVVFPAGGTGNAVSVAIISDQKAYTTEGGTFHEDGWRTRDLNFENDPDSIVTLASSTSGTAEGGGHMGNSFTLIAGTYLIQFSCPTYDTIRHTARLYNITGDAQLTSSTAQTGQPRAFGSFIHTIASSNIYEIQHYQNAADVADYGLGLAADITTNIYTLVNIFKIK